VDRSLNNTLAKVLLYIVAAMRLIVSCLPRGTCCRHYPMFVSTIAALLLGEEVVVIVAAVVEALALRVHAFAGEGLLLLAAALLGLLFLVQSVAA
jgi:hypothetical protein